MHDYLKGQPYPIMSMFFFLNLTTPFLKIANGISTILLHVVYSAKTKIRSRV